MKKPTGFCNALFPCKLNKGILCYSNINCENKLTHFEDGTYVFDDCNKDKFILTDVKKFIEVDMFIIATIIIWTILMIGLGYAIGYVNGFKKSKEIDDKIIEELGDKYAR